MYNSVELFVGKKSLFIIIGGGTIPTWQNQSIPVALNNNNNEFIILKHNLFNK